MRARDRINGLRALLGQPLRTLLTLLGIIIGSGAIVLVAGLVHGAEVALVAANQSISGSDLVQVRAKDLPPRERLRGRPELSRADGVALGDSILGADREAHTESSHDARAQVGAKKKQVRFVSAAPGAAQLFRLGIAEGRFIDETDLRDAKRVCVIGQEVWQELFGGAPIGTNSTIRADNVVWSVIGVLEHKPLIGSTTGTGIWARKVIVPESTFDAVYTSDHHVQRVVLRGEGGGVARLPLELIRPAITELLLRRHQGARNFKLDDSAARELERTILSVIKLLLIASGILTLSTGAINVANVMFVSVSERTREIGLRRALGETRRSILIQFLLEAATLGVVGGVLGLALGSAAVELAGFGLTKVFSAFAAQVEPWSLVSGFVLSVFAGLVAGLLPAMRAAGLDPVVALRAE